MGLSSSETQAINSVPVAGNSASQISSRRLFMAAAALAVLSGCADPKKSYLAELENIENKRLSDVNSLFTESDGLSLRSSDGMVVRRVFNKNQECVARIRVQDDGTILVFTAKNGGDPGPHLDTNEGEVAKVFTTPEEAATYLKETFGEKKDAERK